jgi:hypothetical protein
VQQLVDAIGQSSVRRLVLNCRGFFGVGVTIGDSLCKIEALQAGIVPDVKELLPTIATSKSLEYISIGRTSIDVADAFALGQALGSSRVLNAVDFFSTVGLSTEMLKMIVEAVPNHSLLTRIDVDVSSPAVIDRIFGSRHRPFIQLMVTLCTPRTVKRLGQRSVFGALIGGRDMLQLVAESLYTS